MKKTAIIIAAFFGLMACQQSQSKLNLESGLTSLSTQAQYQEAMTQSNFYDFEVTDLQGNSFSFSQLKGKRVLIVNVASKCGFTPQYKDMQELYEKYGGDKFTVIGFPCNQFGRQEPGSNEEIEAFCEKNYGVSFPIMDKVEVKGSNQHPVYAWLTKGNGVGEAKVSWNFNKFLVEADGTWVKHFGSRTNPLDDEIVAFAKGN